MCLQSPIKSKMKAKTPVTVDCALFSLPFVQKESIVPKKKRSSSDCRRRRSSDNDFEWYDLDVILGPSSDESSNSENTDDNDNSSTDFSEGVETNSTFATTLPKKKLRNPNNNTIEFDLFAWTISVEHHFGETPEDREFREKMEDLEQEILTTSISCDNDSVSSNQSFLY